MIQLHVSLEATHSHDTNQFDNDMVLVAEVRDADGEPVTGLDKDDFEAWQLGITGFGRIRIILVQDLSDVDDALNGIYHLVPRWARYTETQTAFAVVVSHDGNTGRAMTSLVTQGSQS